MLLSVIYFAIGLLLVVVAVASRGKEERTKGFEINDDGDGFDAGLLIFIALLWPAWLLASATKKDPKE